MTQPQKPVGSPAAPARNSVVLAPPPGTWLVAWNVLPQLDAVTTTIINVGVFPVVVDQTPLVKNVYVSAVSASDAQTQAQTALTASNFAPQGAPTSVTQLA